MKPFHLAILVSNLEKARSFYSGVLCLKEKRSTLTSIHYDFFGHHLVLHESSLYQAMAIPKQVKLDSFSYPHFGIVLSFDEWESLRQHLESENVEFFIPPCKRFVGENHEENVMFILDPSQNIIEIKHYTQLAGTDWL
ncbi:VOC family protein [Nodularia sp. LEGE 04288]|uniref:VOC family protein n=1 Tax=Nodularia sp. LEGE 04288 TaxID=1828639 RepID=UPI001D124874|nr:VOC family protein [Nodularia sp. LEGE 04288]MCC2695325.1 VOC family protein [Nodularia sp. LEGE 04288]